MTLKTFTLPDNFSFLASEITRDYIKLEWDSLASPFKHFSEFYYQIHRSSTGNGIYECLWTSSMINNNHSLSSRRNENNLDNTFFDRDVSLFNKGDRVCYLLDIYVTKETGNFNLSTSSWSTREKYNSFLFLPSITWEFE
ncbi:hypothetical protein V1503_23595 [Bacillus sp. SCS-151]|uniref:hypothetical protein n=1 Tax=Nanhaiella sioensis TaxID=3115293 RepID=UPI00397918B5